MIKRRLILQMAGLTCAVSPVRLLLANTAAEHELRLLVVKDDHASPLFSAGDLLLADTRQTRYAGDDIYLYPNWGAPRPYLVRLIAAAGVGQMLEFRNPGNEQLLWTQSPGLEDQFAGRFVEHFAMPHVIGQTGNYPLRRGIAGIISNISGKV